jgi:hypothetical protein
MELRFPSPSLMRSRRIVRLPRQPHRSSRRVTRYFHEKAASSQVHVLVVRHDSFPPTSGRRTVLAFPPPTSIADSPYSICTLLWSSRSGVLSLERVLPSRTRIGYRSFRATSFLACVAVTRTRRLGSNPVRQLSSFAPAVNYDCAMARTLRRLPRAGEVCVSGSISHPLDGGLLIPSRTKLGLGRHGPEVRFSEANAELRRIFQQSAGGGLHEGR